MKKQAFWKRLDCFKEVAKMNVAETRHQAFKAPLAFE